MRHKREHSPTEALVILAMRSTPEPFTYARLIETTGASPHTLPPIMRKIMEQGIAYFTIAPEVK